MTKPQIAGHEYLRQLGSGGYGEVHLYREVGLSRDVAVKVITDATALSAGAAQQLASEAAAMASLEHPNVVRLYGTGQTAESYPYISMMVCQRQTMADRAVGGRLDLATVLRTGILVGSALHSAHAAGVLHRDIKPANILLTTWNAPVLADFGVAGHLADESTDDDIGISVPWAAPEMLFEDLRGDPSTEVYSLAATIWHLLEGRSPYERPNGDNSRLALMERIRVQPVPDVRRADVPVKLSRVLRQALAKDPAMRPQSMRAMVESLCAAEQAAGLAATEPIYVGAAAGDGSPHDASPDRHGGAHVGPGAEVGTRIRARQAGMSQPAVTAAALGQPEPPDAAREPVASRRTIADGQSTRLRPSISNVEMPVGPAPRPSSTRRMVLLGIGGVLAVVAVFGVWLIGHGPNKPVNATSTTVADDPGDTGVGLGRGDAPPGPVTVTATRKGDSVQFAWSYTAALPTDSFRYQIVGGAQGVVTKPTVTVRSKSRICLEVKVFRADGSNADPSWSTPGCVAH